MISMAFRTLQSFPMASASRSLIYGTRIMMSSSAGSDGNENSMAEAAFEKVADETLERLTDRIDHILDMNSDIDSDVSLSSGVLTVNLGQKGTYVINKQTPNKQLWLSSPLSGPKRFDLDATVWRYKREGITLTEILEKEFSQLLNQRVVIKLSQQ